MPKFAHMLLIEQSGPEPVVEPNAQESRSARRPPCLKQSVDMSASQPTPILAKQVSHAHSLFGAILHSAVGCCCTPRHTCTAPHAASCAVHELLREQHKCGQKTSLMVAGMQGSLLKRGSRIGESWNQRWVTLHEAELAYGYSQKGKVIDRIPIQEILDVISHPQPPRPAHTETESVGSHERDEVTGATQRRDDVDLKNTTPFPTHERAFTIITSEEGSKEGRKYTFKAESEQEKQDWVEAILQGRAAYVPLTYTMLQRAQLTTKSFYQSNSFQFAAALCILVNFVCNAVEAELNPVDGTRTANILEQFDYAFVIIFTVELGINAFGHFFREFINDAWNWFDTIVVVISLVSKFSSGSPGLNVLRTTRAFRVFRLFKRLKSLRQIMGAITMSLPAVCNAFFLVILMTMIYAIMGTTFIKDIDENSETYFGRFSTSMYTMFLIMTFDNAAGLTWSLMDGVEGWDKMLVALFCVSYQLIVAFILCNIVMAVLLDKFSEASEASKAEDVEEKIAELARRSTNALDPLLAQLSEIDTDTELQKRVKEVFEFVDEDGSTRLDFNELRSGLKRLETDPMIDFTETDFRDHVVRRGFAGADAEMDFKHFKAFMDLSLTEYLQKQVAKAAGDVNSDEKITAILRSLQQIASVTCETEADVEAIVKTMASCQEHIQSLEACVCELYCGGELCYPLEDKNHGGRQQRQGEAVRRP